MASNGKKEALKKELQKLIDRSYDQNFGKKDGKEISEDDFYHAIVEIIGELNEEKGAMQVKLPERGKLKQKYDAHYKPSSNNQTLSKDEFNKIVMEIITFDRFRLGKGALDVIAFLFGVPIGALFAKRFIPRGESVSDDMLIPAVTSLTVFVLAKTNRL